MQLGHWRENHKKQTLEQTRWQSSKIKMDH